MRGDPVDEESLREVLRKRSQVLASVADDPATKPDLLDRLSVSRSTVDRALASLVDAGLVRRIDGDYRITPGGRLALSAYREYVDTTSALAEAAPLLDGLPVDATLDRALLEAGTVNIAEPQAPENAITEAVQELQSAERLLVFSPVVKSNYIRLVHKQVESRDLDVTLVLERGASESLASLADVTETVEALVDSDSFSLLSTDHDLPFMLYLMLGSGTDSVGVTVPEDGGIVGSVVASDPGAVDWGREWFDDVQTDATPVRLSTLL